MEISGQDACRIDLSPYTDHNCFFRQMKRFVPLQIGIAQAKQLAALRQFLARRPVVDEDVVSGPPSRFGFLGNSSPLNFYPSYVSQLLCQVQNFPHVTVSNVHYTQNPFLLENHINYEMVSAIVDEGKAIGLDLIGVDP
jgi:hypothetical protein